eukprot:1566029-Prymnesium_polylepis.1
MARAALPHLDHRLGEVGDRQVDRVQVEELLGDLVQVEARVHGQDEFQQVKALLAVQLGVRRQLEGDPGVGDVVTARRDAVVDVAARCPRQHVLVADQLEGDAAPHALLHHPPRELPAHWRWPPMVPPSTSSDALTL